MADPRARTALVQNFFSQWLQVRNVWLLTPDASRQVSVVRRQPAHRVRQGNGAVPREPAAGRPQHASSCLTANYTYLNEQLARHYGIRGRLRKPFPPRGAGRPEPLGSARQGEHTVGDVLPAPHLADDSRQVAAREYSGGSGAASAAGREHHARRREDGESIVRARDARAPPRESCVRELPCQHGPARLQPRELRRDRPMAHEGWRRRRSTLPECCWTARASMGRPRCEPRCCSRRSNSSRRSPESCCCTRSAARSITTMPPRFAAIVRAAATDDYRWSSTILAIVKSTPFQMRRAKQIDNPTKAEPRSAAKAQPAGREPRRE